MSANLDAEQIANRAAALYEASDNKDDTKMLRDVAGLYLLAIKTAAGSYPEAESQLAWIYFLLHDYDNARRCAKSSLKNNPDLFVSQYIMLGFAFTKLPGFFANMKFEDEFRKLVRVFQNLCQSGLNDTTFAYYADVMMQLADNPMSRGASSMKFVYEAIATAPLESVWETHAKGKEELAQVRLVAEARLLTA